jgi:hypothetical protein
MTLRTPTLSPWTRACLAAALLVAGGCSSDEGAGDDTVDTGGRRDTGRDTGRDDGTADDTGEPGADTGEPGADTGETGDDTEVDTTEPVDTSDTAPADTTEPPDISPPDTDGSGADACTENEKLPSNLGCEYWAVDLPQDRGNSIGGDGRGGAEAQTWAVVVSNPGSTPATVGVYASSDLATAIRTVSVAPQGLQIIEMPRNDIYATSITDNAFRIVSDIPVAAHQFNPLDNVAVQSNDASLLFPVNALTGSYRILSYKTRVTWYAAATVVAVAEGTTNVTVISPDEIRSPEDSELGEEGVMDGWDDRSPRSFALRQGQVLNLATRFSTDITGMSIEADQPVAVFSSAAGIYIPNSAGTADHIEHQMLPIEAWRDRYVGVPFAPRGTALDYFRVIAANDGTEVRASLPLSDRGWSAGVARLSAGQWAEFATNQPFELVATGPIQVAHYMAGSQAPGVPQTCASAAGQVGLGDPALTVLVPNEQWRDFYTILIPNGYAEDWISLYGPTGTSVSVRGNDGSRASVVLDQPIAGTTWAFARWPVPRAPGGGTTAANVFQLSAGAPFGTEVSGMSCAVSYAYPGGLNLRDADAP